MESHSAETGHESDQLEDLEGITNQRQVGKRRKQVKSYQQGDSSKSQVPQIAATQKTVYHEDDELAMEPQVSTTREVPQRNSSTSQPLEDSPNLSHSEWISTQAATSPPLRSDMIHSGPSSPMHDVRSSRPRKRGATVTFDIPDAPQNREVVQRDRLTNNKPSGGRSNSKSSSKVNEIHQLNEIYQLHQSAIEQWRQLPVRSDGLPFIPPPPPEIGIPPKKMFQGHHPQPSGSVQSFSMDPPLMPKTIPPPPIDFHLPRDLMTHPEIERSPLIATVDQSIGMNLLGLDWQRLELLRSKVLRYRSHVVELRDRAREQNLRARQANDLAWDAASETANRGEIVSHGMLGFDTKSATKARLHDVQWRAQAAWAAAASIDDDLEHAESRLSRLEGKLHKQEKRVFDSMKTIVASGFALQERAAELVEDGSSISEPSGSESDDLSPESREYFDTVADINMLRDRLLELETNYRDELKIDFESATDKSAQPIDQVILETYHVTQAENVRRLMDLRLKAESLWADWKTELLKALDNEHEAPHEEALKYNIGGEVGAMYSFHYEDVHWGIRPIELRLVPYVHIEDYISRWLVETEFNVWGEHHEHLDNPEFVNRPWDNDSFARRPYQHSQTQPEARFRGVQQLVVQSDPGCNCCRLDTKDDPRTAGVERLVRKITSWDGECDDSIGIFGYSRRFAMSLRLAFTS